MEPSIVDLIGRRFSCRIHPDRPLTPQHRQSLQEFLQRHRTGPFGSPLRFQLIAADEAGRRSLKGLGTYGFIKHAQGFIVGAMGQGEKNLEDFGYVMEQAILYATSLEIGTCWLGGSFTKSGFANKMAVTESETVPAVASAGYIADASKAEDWIRRRAGGAMRLPAEQLFFDGVLGQPLPSDASGAYAKVLEMVRWGPSASNKQPWRIVRDRGAWHFYLQRTKGYGQASLMGKLLKVADVQRLDMGIAMCHFELSARELGLPGRWNTAGRQVPRQVGPLTEYVISWETE